MIGINKQVHSTPLFNALNIESINLRLLRDKINLFIRLCRNKMINEFMLQINKEYPAE